MAEPTSVASAVYAMEDDVRELRSWARVLSLISGTPSNIEPDALGAIASVLNTLGRRLEERWDIAAKIADPETKRSGGQPCA